MKEHRVKPSKAAVTTIDVSGRQHHYFHSLRLGKSRALLIGEDENLAIPYQLTDTAKAALAESKRLKLEQDSQHKLVQEQAALDEQDDCLPTEPECYDYTDYSDDELLRHYRHSEKRFWEERPFGWTKQDQAEENASNEAMRREIAKRGIEP